MDKQNTEGLVAYFKKIQKANKEGYAGCLPNGNLVDRREVPHAYPIAANPMFDIAMPRCIECQQVTPIKLLKESICITCRRKKGGA